MSNSYKCSDREGKKTLSLNIFAVNRSLGIKPQQYLFGLEELLRALRDMYLNNI